jgi:hypothetical protein
MKNKFFKFFFKYFFSTIFIEFLDNYPNSNSKYLILGKLFIHSVNIEVPFTSRLLSLFKIKIK